MWGGPVKHIPGCTCGFIDGYHGWHLPTCDLVRAGKSCACVGYRWQHYAGCTAMPSESVEQKP